MDRQLDDVVRWFKDYVHWLVTHPFGLEERDAPEQPRDLLCRAGFKGVLVEQMTGNGSFPLELTRTKPYAYSLFNLDALAVQPLLWVD